MAVEKIITVFRLQHLFLWSFGVAFANYANVIKNTQKKKPEKYICSPLQIFLPFRVIRAVRKEAHKQDARAPAARFIRHTSLWYSLCRRRGANGGSGSSVFYACPNYTYYALRKFCAAHILLNTDALGVGWSRGGDALCAALRHTDNSKVISRAERSRLQHAVSCAGTGGLRSEFVTLIIGVCACVCFALHCVHPNAHTYTHVCHSTSFLLGASQIAGAHSVPKKRHTSFRLKGPHFLCTSVRSPPALP